MIKIGKITHKPNEKLKNEMENTHTHTHTQRTIQILRLGNTMNEIKNAIKSIDRRLHQAEGRICGLEDRNFEITQSEENKGKRMRKSEENLHDLWDTFTRNNLTIAGVPEGE